MNSDPHTVLLDDPREVDVAAIEGQLTELWRGAPGPDSAAPVIRACSLNLIVVAEEECRSSALAEMVGDVTVEHPARVFLANLERHDPVSSVEAWISARCALPVPGHNQVCCEEIKLIARGSGVNTVASIVTSLLVPDVPSVLLWKGSVLESDPVLRGILQVSDRMLIDSSEEASPEPTLLAFSGLMTGREAQGSMHAGGEKVTFGDLAWTHLAMWRLLLAQVFQPADMRPLLRDLVEISIEYSSSEGPVHSGRSQAWLLVAWLADRLHWHAAARATGRGTFELSMEPVLGDSAFVAVSIIPVAPQPRSPGGVESIVLRTRSGRFVRVCWTEARDAVQVIRDTKEATLTPVIGQAESALVARELEELRRDGVYEDTMRMLPTMCQEVKP
jgi:glucose-6-phosphate dehydrogenase assembly protein OpcA